tara:strand:+ start:972 stop:1157 length:186 start_codon:yes stop_codon:yes gene_type:complete
MANLWDDDKKKLYKEIYNDLIEEGYTHQEARKHAKLDVADKLESDADFINEIIRQEYGDYD